MRLTQEARDRMVNEKEKPYRGYGHPPQEYKWVRGQSGNPRGRPKGSTNQRWMIDKIMNGYTELRIDGKIDEITRAEVLLWVLYDLARKGDIRAIKMLLKLHSAIGCFTIEDDDDNEALQMALARFREGRPRGEDDDEEE